MRFFSVRCCNGRSVRSPDRPDWSINHPVVRPFLAGPTTPLAAGKKSASGELIAGSRSTQLTSCNSLLRRHYWLLPSQRPLVCLPAQEGGDVEQVLLSLGRGEAVLRIEPGEPRLHRGWCRRLGGRCRLLLLGRGVARPGGGAGDPGEQVRR